VASILLAFGIDAAWDVRQEREAEDQLLRTLLAEIEVNREEFEYRRTQGAEARSAQLKLVDLIGPESGTLSVDSLGALFITSIGYGIAEIESAALDAVLVGIDSPTPSRTRLLRLLRDYRTELEDHRLEDRREWIDLRMELQLYLVTVSPHPLVWAHEDGHGPTDFDIPVAALLRDRRLEGLLSILASRARLMMGTTEILSELADSIAMLATAELR